MLEFLQAIKRKQNVSPLAVQRRGNNPALKMVDGLLVFTGEVDSDAADWVRVVREEREAELARHALGNSSLS